MTTDASSKASFSPVLDLAFEISGFNWLVILLAIIARELLSIVSAGIVLAVFIENSEVAIFSSIFVRIAVHLLLQPCIIRLVLELCRTNKLPSIEKLFSNWILHVCFLFNSLIYFALVFFGLGMFLIPGIYLITALAFWGVAMIDQGIRSPKQAFAASFNLARGNFWTIFRLIFGAMLLGLIPGFHLLSECLLTAWLSYLYLKLTKQERPSGDPSGAVKNNPFYYVPALALVSLLGSFSLTATFRQIVEGRYIAGQSMFSTFPGGARVLVEKVSGLKGRPYSRGDIVVFYPPAEETGYYLEWDLPHIAGRLVGFPIFPNSMVYISRVIGLPGEKIEVKEDGVYINSKRINEDEYIVDAARYKLLQLSDLGRNKPLPKYYGNDAPIIVPPDKVFVLGDVRNDCTDSSLFGFVDKSSIIGRHWIQLTPSFKIYRLPEYRDK